MKSGGEILSIAPDSPVRGLKPGDRLLAINEKPLQDILDYLFLSAGEDSLILTAESGDKIKKLKVRKALDEPLGLEFTSDLFDRIKTCPGKCIFCFMDQNPPGVRSTLHLKDDDYRLSFLHGNYLTLHNLSGGDLQRIKNYRLSPLYVSVHATDPEVRELIFQSRSCREILPKLKKLADADIGLNLQIVLMPGINDGDVLERTLNDLSRLSPALNSIAVVPVGITGHRRGLYPLTPVEGDKAREVLEQLNRWQDKFKKTLGTRLVFPADEFFLIAGLPFPAYGYYEGFPQLEDGVGLSRWLISGIKKIAHRFSRPVKSPRKAGLVTGIMGAEVLKQALSFMPAKPGLEATLLPVENRFFGEKVTVTGLLSGRDIMRTLKSQARQFDFFILPQVCLKDGKLFLDDLTIEELRQEVRKEIKTVPVTPGALLKALVE